MRPALLLAIVIAACAEKEAPTAPPAPPTTPEAPAALPHIRYYSLGRTVGDRYLFLCFWSDGKNVRVIVARELTAGEQRFYDRKYASFK